MKKWIIYWDLLRYVGFRMDWFVIIETCFKPHDLHGKVYGETG